MTWTLCIWTLCTPMVAPTTLGDDHDRFYRAFYRDLAQGMTEAALAEYRELRDAFEDDPDHRAWVRVRIAACELRLGRRDRASRALEEAGKVDGIGEPVKRALAEVRAALEGKPTEPGPATDPESVSTSAARKAVDAGLRYLIEHQRVDGRWPSQTEVQGRPIGIEGLDPGVTALVVSTLHESGVEIDNDSDAGRALDRGVRWLLSQQENTGRIGYSRRCEEWIYNHGLATRALAQIYAATKEPSLRDPVTRAVEYILEHQNPRYGWKYEAKAGLNDTSVTATMIAALVLARDLAQNRRIDLDPARIVASIEWGRNWTDRATSRTSGRTGYESPGDQGSRLQKIRERYEFRALPTMTAAGMCIRFVAGETRESQIVRVGASLLMKDRHLPKYSTPTGKRLSRINFVYWHWGTRAMRLIGGPSWQKWRGELLRALLPQQRDEGHWEAAGAWSPAGGRILSTVLAVSTLIEAER